MELFNGRPEDISGRLPREVRTYDFRGLEHTSEGD